MTQSTSTQPRRALRVGDIVRVKNANEILATLDEHGEFENLPFMPEMLKYCGREMTVHKVATKLCDTVSGEGGLRKMINAVHLTGARCDGSSHGGCQTACSLYWKEAWLEPSDERHPEPDVSNRIDITLLEVNTRKDAAADGGTRFSCQATELLRAAPICLPYRDLGQYVADVKTGNASAIRVLITFLIGLFNRIQDVSKRILPRRLWFRDGLRWGFIKGQVSGRTPTLELNLQPGEMVRIKSKAEILKTLNERQLNRGMGFEEEMARYCGRTARVRARVTHCIDEKTGELLTMKNPCIILDNVVCAGVYNANCPREFIPFWREIWLDRV